MKLWWVPLIIPFCIQLPCLIVQLVFMRKSMKLSKKQMEELPHWLIENSKLWKINRILVEWIKINHPDSYEDFKTVCLTESDMELLQIKESEDVTDGRND